MNNNLTLWLPGLRPEKQLASKLVLELSQLSMQQQPQLKFQFNNINLLLARADRVAVTDIIKHDFMLELLTEQPLTESVSQPWPLAEWRLAVDNVELSSESNHWLCADPVYLHADRSAALLHAHEELPIKTEEAQAIAKLINHHYKDEPWQLHVGSSHRWYIQLDNAIELITKPLASVKGQNVFEHLPSGRDSRYWQQCMNEIQMLLHNSDVNQQREAQGLMPINSLWFWGYSSSSIIEPLPWQHIYSDNAVLKGLGLLCGSKVNKFPDSIDDVINDEAEVLICFDKLENLLQQQDIYAWLNELQFLQDNWFSPLIERLKNNPQTQLTVLLDKGEAYQLKSKHLKRWWRRSNKNNIF